MPATTLVAVVVLVMPGKAPPAVGAVIMVVPGKTFAAVVVGYAMRHWFSE
jgi:hypothetical protein